MCCILYDTKQYSICDIIKVCICVVTCFSTCMFICFFCGIPIYYLIKIMHESNDNISQCPLMWSYLLISLIWYIVLLFIWCSKYFVLDEITSDYEEYKHIIKIYYTGLILFVFQIIWGLIILYNPCSIYKDTQVNDAIFFIVILEILIFTCWIIQAIYMCYLLWSFVDDSNNNKCKCYFTTPHVCSVPALETNNESRYKCYFFDLYKKWQLIKIKPICVKKSSIHNDNDCAICLFEIKNKQKLKCNHVFCYECIIKWKNTGHTDCPLCRETDTGLIDII